MYLAPNTYEYFVSDNFNQKVYLSHVGNFQILPALDKWTSIINMSCHASSTSRSFAYCRDSGWTFPSLLLESLSAPSKFHINCLDLKVVFLALCHWAPVLQGHHVMVATNTTMVVSYINKQGSLSLLSLAVDLSVKISYFPLLSLNSR